MPYLSVVLPVYNEEGNLPELMRKLEIALDSYDYEIIAVNDGSRDRSFEIIKEACQKNERIKAINFRRNYGQTAAINAGIHFTQGELIAIIDSDLENDPSDITILIEKLNEGYDLVSGWRQARWKGQFFTRKLPSIMANKLISKVSGVKLHDYGCTLKVYRRDVIKDILLYGQMHRFIPVYCHWQGGRVTELPVNYTPRRFGKSNYGLSRTYKVILDLLMIKFMDKYMQRPIHFFGSAGLISFIISLASAALAFYFKFTGQKDLIQTPLPVFSAVFFIVGVLMILLGVNAEILMRTYYESQNKLPYTIRNMINL